MTINNGMLDYGDQSIAYMIVQSSNLTKKVRIHVYPNGQVEVETPSSTSEKEIHQAVRKRARWIMSQLKAAADTRAHALPREYISGETHFYLGRRYQLKIDQKSSATSSVKLVGGKIFITLPVKDRAAVKSRLQNWYKRRATEYLTQRVNIVSEGIRWLGSPPPVKLVRMQKQWGSCSPTGAINLSLDLIKAPRDCIDYVITHEICHLKEHNHSKRYYALLESCSPNWKHTKSKLDAMAELILSS